MNESIKQVNKIILFMDKTKKQKKTMKKLYYAKDFFCFFWKLKEKKKKRIQIKCKIE